MQQPLRIPGLVLAACLLAACASSKPVVQSEQAPNVDFSRYHTYSWAEEPQTQSPIVRDKLVRAIDAELAARGLQRVADGDIAVVGHLATQEEVSYNHFSLGLGVGGWGSNSGGGIGGSTGTSTPKTNLTGTLVIDLFDAKSKQAIWRATASGNVPQTPETVDAAIGQYIPQMFAKFPKR
jgi:hypothetical protein